MSEMNDRQPSGWVKTTLSEVASASRAKAEPGNLGNVPYIGLEHIEGGSNRILSIGRVTDVKSIKSIFQRGDVLYGKLRPYLKKVCRPDFDGVCSTDILVFLESPNIDNGYLLYFLSQQSTADYATQNSNGINLPRISSRALGEIEFPLPPLAEQRRIVAKIEALQERSRRAREVLSEVAPLLEQFRQSVLAAAFRGDLTADWRAAHPNVEPASELLYRIRAERHRRWEQAELAKYEAQGQKPPKNWQDKYEELEPVDDSDLPELPKGWVWTTWESILSPDDGSFKRGPFGSALKKSIFVSSGYKVYEQYCPINDDCSYVRYYVTPEKYEELKAFAVKAGDFLISCSGVTLGRITQVPDDFEEGIIKQALLRVRINNEIVNDQFFLRLFRSPHFQRQVFDNATGAAIPNVKGVKDPEAIPVPVPPLAEQLEILERLKERLDYIRGIAEDVKESNAAFDHLDQSILAKAFRGELVPQDPRDEPASALLERIRAQPTQRAESTKQTSKVPRRSNTGKKWSRLEPPQLTLAEVLRTTD